MLVVVFLDAVHGAINGVFFRKLGMVSRHKSELSHAFAELIVGQCRLHLKANTRTSARNHSGLEEVLQENNSVMCTSYSLNCFFTTSVLHTVPKYRPTASKE